MEHRGEQSATAPYDLEKGLNVYYSGDKVETHYVRDFTYRIIPICVAILVVFSDGAILLCTLTFNQPIPRQGVVVISILLAVLLVLFMLGGMCIYYQNNRRRKRAMGPYYTRPSLPPSEAARTRRWTRAIRRTQVRLANLVNGRPLSEGIVPFHYNSAMDGQLKINPNGSDRLTVAHSILEDYVSKPWNIPNFRQWY